MEQAGEVFRMVFMAFHQTAKVEQRASHFLT
jgi:hypothetical protein